MRAVAALRVFVVDDSPIVRERLAILIAELKGRVELIGQAVDPREAIPAIHTLRPDVVTLDIHMPGGSGITLLGEVKTQKPAPVVIMLTNYPYPQYRNKCLAAGADFFFDKSTEFHRVGEVLQQLSASPPTGGRE